MKKRYQQAEYYDRKLSNVMGRMGVEKYEYDWGRRTCFAEFIYKGRAYRFETSVEELQERGAKIMCGSDAFAILVLDLECIARMMEHGTFDLESQQITGLKQLPSQSDLPDCLKTLGFSSMPTPDELKRRYRQAAKVAHPDNGGSEDYFISIQQAYKDAQAVVGGGGDA